MNPKSRTDGQAALGRRDPQALDHMRGVTCESVERELDLHVDRFVILLLVAAVQGDHTTIPQPPARDVSVAARVICQTY